MLGTVFGVCFLIFTALGLLAVLALILPVRDRRVETTPRAAVPTTFLLALFALAIVARTAQLGGEIHHPDVRSGASANAAAPSATALDDRPGGALFHWAA